jgi:predicted oxidoreductase (fatty acid repression mutant protein)
MNTVIKAIAQRRSMTQLTKTPSFNKDLVSTTIQDVLKHTPSAFNSQSSGALVITGDVHVKFWEEVRGRVLPLVSDEKAIVRTNKKIDGFKAGDGTVIFLENQTINQSLRERFPLYASSVDLWADQGQGFVQYGVWLALHELGFGVSLQHYNPLIDDYIYDELKVERHFKIVGQMPFGKIAGEVSNKSYIDLSQRFFER